MPIWEQPITEQQAEALVERTPEALEAFLVSRGFKVTGVSVGLKPPMLRIESDQDPRPDLVAATFPAKRDRAAIRRRLREYAAKVDAGDTPTARETVLAVRALIAALAED